MVYTINDLIASLAEWVWGSSGNSNVVVDDHKDISYSPDICLSQLPFLSSACFMQLFSKCLGMAIICGSMLNKVPIMINMMQSKSAAGISRNSLYGEAIVYANGAMYGYLYGYPFTSYGENASLLIQNIILIIMTWQLTNSNNVSNNKNRVTVLEQLTVIMGFGLYLVGVLQFLPSSYYYMLLSMTWPVMVYARGSQIYETYQVKHTGNLSIITTSMNLFGSLIRIGTTLQETGDLVVLAGYLLSGGLSFGMFIQYWLYLVNTRKVLKQEQKQRQEADTKKTK